MPRSWTAPSKHWDCATSCRVASTLGTAAAAKYVTHRVIPLTPDELKRRPPTTRGGRLPTHRFEFTFDEARKQADENYDGYYAIVTTVPKTSPDALFTRYKQQNYSEQVNSRFQGPSDPSSCTHRQASNHWCS